VTSAPRQGVWDAKGTPPAAANSRTLIQEPGGAKSREGRAPSIAVMNFDGSPCLYLYEPRAVDREPPFFASTGHICFIHQPRRHLEPPPGPQVS
jgi:hypothetical protein